MARIAYLGVSNKERCVAGHIALRVERRNESAILRYPRLVPRDAGEHAVQLAKRTLTNLYNARPTWLDLAHQTLDAAVSAAYGWESHLTEEEILARLLALNLKQTAQDWHTEKK